MNADEPRLTPTQRLHEVTMAAMGRKPSEPESSVTITRNAKGIAQFEVTVRGPDAYVCKNQANQLFDALSTEHPYPVTNGGTAE